MAKGTVTKRGKNVWLLTYDAPRGADGKRNQKTETFHGPKKAADARMTEIQESINKGQYFEAPWVTVKEFSELWEKGTAFRGLSGSSQYEYSRVMLHDVLPVLGDMQLAVIRPFHVESLLQGLFDRDLSGSTVEYVYRVMRHFFRAALDWKFVAANPLEKVSKPSREDCSVLPFTPAEASLIVNAAAAAGIRLWLAVLLALYCGLRRAEVLGLYWSDVDFERKEVTVRRNLLDIPKKGTVFGPPKTRMSRRTISAPEVLLGPLRKYHHRLVAECGALGLPIPGPVCAGPDGELLRPDSLSHAFTRLLKRLELQVPEGASPVNGKYPTRSFHDLRHTHATILLQRRVPVKVVSQRLGHSSVIITLVTYSHVMPGDDQAAAATIDRIFGGVEGNDVYEIFGGVGDDQAAVDALDDIFSDVEEPDVDRMLTNDCDEVV